jgi:FKBP-type peptidyl-prolyl cis-trans isomerase FkpA
MTIRSKVLTGLLLLCMACSNVKETPKGLKYAVVRRGDGNTVKPSQFLVMNMMFKDAKDSVWYDTRKGEFPATTMIADTSAIRREEGIEEIFRLLSKGDSVAFSIPAKTLFEKTFHQPVPPKMDPKGEFTFALGVKDVLEREQFTKLQKEMVARQNEKLRKEQDQQLAKDTVLIDNFLKEKNIHVLETSSGLRYTAPTKGKGTPPSKGQTVKVNYVGYLLSGKVFDTNIESVAKANKLEGRKYEPLAVVLGRRGVIPGWEEALTLMTKGSKMTVYIPSTLAYGPQKRSADIVENTILVFDLDVVDIQDAPKPAKQTPVKK